MKNQENSNDKTASVEKPADDGTRTAAGFGVGLQNLIFDPNSPVDASMFDLLEEEKAIGTASKLETGEDGAEPAVSLLLPAVQAAPEAATQQQAVEDQFVFGGEEEAPDFRDEGDTATVRFGDGVTGARLPSDGQEASGVTGATTQSLVATIPVQKNNIIVGNDGAGDWLIGTNNDDTIYGLGGNDLLSGRDGDDGLYGGAGADSVFGGNGNDVLVTENGEDYLDGGAGADDLYGGNNNDVLIGGNGADDLYGGAGNDTIAGGNGADNYYGGSGIDTASFAGATEGVDVRLWQPGANQTGEGNDTFDSIENVIGSEYGDHIDGTNGGNRLEGGDGSDDIDGGGGNDLVFGGDGNDVLTGGLGNDVIDGGDGFNFVSYRGSSSAVVVDLENEGPQNTGQGIDTILNVTGVYGSTLDDVLQGNGDNNFLYGEEGNDWLFGGGGIDNLLGGEGNDVLVGGQGTDAYHGGEGADAFVYGAFFGDAGQDVIWDYEDGVDHVFVDANFGINDFEDLTVSANNVGDAVVQFNGVFGGSLLFSGINPDQINADDFTFI